MNRKVVFPALLCLATAGLRADFSYEETSRITGGAMMAATRLLGTFSRQMREPSKTSVLVKGDRMAHISAENARIVDLSKETITTIDFQKKTYSVITFAQLRESMNRLSQRAAQPQGEAKADSTKVDVDYKVDVKETGQTRQIAGLTARQVVIAFEMEGTDRESGNKATMTANADNWVAPKVPGYDEVQSFYARMAQKINWTPGVNFSAAQPGFGRAIVQAKKESAKLDGMTVLQITRLTAKGDGTAQPGQAAPPQPQQQQPAAQPPSAGTVAEGAAAGAITGRLGRLGGLGGLGGLRRRRQEPKEEQPPQQPPAQQPPQGQPVQTEGVLMEMTTELNSFSSAPIPDARFAVPAGFKQVQSEMVSAAAQ